MQNFDLECPIKTHFILWVLLGLNHWMWWHFTLSMSAASLRLCAMSSDSVSRSVSWAGLYNWPTSSLCRQSFTWFTRKCITAFGTLQTNKTAKDWETESCYIKDITFLKIKKKKKSNKVRDSLPVLNVFAHNKKVWLDETFDDLTVSLLSCR